VLQVYQHNLVDVATSPLIDVAAFDPATDAVSSECMLRQYLSKES
jgi:hypothetical protein